MLMSWGKILLYAWQKLRFFSLFLSFSFSLLKYLSIGYAILSFHFISIYVFALYGVYERCVSLFAFGCICSHLVVAASAAVTVINVAQREFVKLTCAYISSHCLFCLHLNFSRSFSRSLCECVYAPLFFSSSFDNDIDQFRDCRLFGFILICLFISPTLKSVSIVVSFSKREKKRI